MSVEIVPEPASLALVGGNILFDRVCPPQIQRLEAPSLNQQTPSSQRGFLSEHLHCGGEYADDVEEEERPPFHTHSSVSNFRRTLHCISGKSRQGTARLPPSNRNYIF